MRRRTKSKSKIALAVLVACLANTVAPGIATAQELELKVNKEAILKFDFDIPEIVVDDPAIFEATPISKNEIKVVGKQQGFCNLTIRGADGEEQEISVSVVRDLRKVKQALKGYFPDAAIKIKPVGTDMLLVTGEVMMEESSRTVMTVVKDLCPKQQVINGLVIAKKDVEVKVKAYEISNKKLGEADIDWNAMGIDKKIESVNELAEYLVQAKENGSSLVAGAVEDSGKLNSLLTALEKHSIAKLLDQQPVLEGSPARPLKLLAGDQQPVPSSSDHIMEFSFSTTNFQLLPLLASDKRIALEMKIEASNDVKRTLNTGFVMKPELTTVLAGNFPSEKDSDRELLILLTSRWVDAKIKAEEIR